MINKILNADFFPKKSSKNVQHSATLQLDYTEAI